MILAAANIGPIIIRYAAWISAALFIAAWAIELAGRGQPDWERRARWGWTLGCLLFLAHFLAAFGGMYGWSLETLKEITAQQMDDFTGRRWGWPIWGKLMFAILWLADTLWWWLAPARRSQRARWLTVAIYGFLGISQFLACVVFAESFLRWIALAGFAFLGVLCWLKRRRH